MGDEDSLTPDEMKSAGLDRLTPAEMKGRMYAPPREHSDDELGLDGGLIPYGFTSPDKSPLEKEQAGPYGGDIAFLKEAAPFLVGGALGKGASYLLGRGATAGASSAAGRGAEAASQWLARSLEHGTLQSLPISVAKAMLPEGTGAAMGAGARIGAAGGASAAPGAAAVTAGGALPGTLTPGQQAALLLLGRSPDFPETK
jgi:hypothetical protein